MKRFDVVALGELLIDFTQNGISSQGNIIFEANPGGAPCNVLAMLQKLGKSTAFIGKVGNDFLGKTLIKEVHDLGINTDNLLMDNKVNTTLAFVHNYPDGERDFSFYRNPGADMMLRIEEIDTETIKNSKVFHCGTLSMTDFDVREATYFAIETAKANNVLVSFDPNLREPLWESLDRAKEQILYGLSQCDILKISDNEIEFLTGEKNIEKGIEKIIGMTSAKLICATMGKDGSYGYCNGKLVYAPGILVENVVDTTGAGDTFCACQINYVLENSLNLNKKQLTELLEFANKAASKITLKKGALKVMPTIDELELN